MGEKSGLQGIDARRLVILGKTLKTTTVENRRGGAHLDIELCVRVEYIHGLVCASRFALPRRVASLSKEPVLLTQASIERVARLAVTVRVIGGHGPGLHHGTRKEGDICSSSNEGLFALAKARNNLTATRRATRALQRRGTLVRGRGVGRMRIGVDGSRAATLLSIGLGATDNASALLLPAPTVAVALGARAVGETAALTKLVEISTQSFLQNKGDLSSQSTQGEREVR